MRLLLLLTTMALATTACTATVPELGRTQEGFDATSFATGAGSGAAQIEPALELVGRPSDELGILEPETLHHVAWAETSTLRIDVYTYRADVPVVGDVMRCNVVTQSTDGEISGSAYGCPRLGQTEPSPYFASSNGYQFAVVIWAPAAAVTAEVTLEDGTQIEAKLVEDNALVMWPGPFILEPFTIDLLDASREVVWTRYFAGG